MTPDALVHVVDDDEAARESLEFLLRAASFDVRTYEAPQAPDLRIDTTDTDIAAGVDAVLSLLATRGLL